MSEKTIALVIGGAGVAALALWLTLGRSGCGGEVKVENKVEKIPVVVKTDEGLGMDGGLKEIRDQISEIREQRGTVKVRARVTVQKGDTVGQVKEVVVDVVIPKDENVTPAVTTDATEGNAFWGSGIDVEAEYVPVTDPWLQLRIRPLVGCSADWIRGLSPVAAVSVLDIAGVVHAGASADRFGCAPFLSAEVWREWHLLAKYNVIRFDDAALKLQLGIAYRL